MNDHPTLSQQLALHLIEPAFGRGLSQLPRRAPDALGRRGDLLLDAARVIADAWWDPDEPTSPAETRLLRNRRARQAAEALDRLIAESSSELRREDLARLREMAHELSLGWEEVEQFLKREPVG